MNKKAEVKDQDLVVVKEKLKGMQKMLDTTMVTSDNELNGVSDKIKGIKTLLKMIEQKKEKFTEPAKAIIAEARETYDPMIKECRNAEIVLKDRAKKYMDEKEAKRIADEKKLADKVESGYMKPETAMKKMEDLPEAPKTVRTDTGSGLRMAKRKVAKIENPDLIPDEYWVIDEVRVRREALEREKNGLPQIPGVVISEESSLASI
jgi:vancomycin resistance protein YoaR